jgi:hypothetical protein
MPINYFSQMRETAYAGFWLRFGAAIIDGLITGAAAAIVGGCIGAVLVAISMPVTGTSISALAHQSSSVS